MNIFASELKKTSEEEIGRFLVGGAFPYTTRSFFIQHLVPYIVFRPLCRARDVLEIGIGKGYGSYFLSFSSKKVISLDNDYSTKLNLDKYVRRDRIANVHFVNADAITIPFKDASFDRIICCQVIEHIPEELLAFFLKQVSRVLKDDGVCLFTTLNVERNIKNRATYEKFYQHHKEFCLKEFRDLLSGQFPYVKVFGLGVGMGHRLFLRLKRWGFMKYGFFGFNPVIKFFDGIKPRDFVVSQRLSRRTIDLMGFCKKKPPVSADGIAWGRG